MTPLTAVRGHSSPAARLDKHIKYQLRIQLQNYVPFGITRLLRTLQSDFSPLIYVFCNICELNTRHLGKWNSVLVGCRGQKQCPGRSSCICFCCFLLSECVLHCIMCPWTLPSWCSSPHGHFTLLCFTSFTRPLRLAFLWHCDCNGSAANRFDCIQLQRMELVFHCLEWDLINMGDIVYIFMFLCWQMRTRVTQ